MPHPPCLTGWNHEPKRVQLEKCSCTRVCFWREQEESGTALEGKAFRFQVAGFGLRISESGYGFWVSGFGFRVSSFGVRISGFARGVWEERTVYAGTRFTLPSLNTSHAAKKCIFVNLTCGNLYIHIYIYIYLYINTYIYTYIHKYK